MEIISLCYILCFNSDVSGVELLMNNHQSLKAEIDARGDNFSACIALGKELLSRGHYASSEIKEKLVALTNQRNTMLHRWEERWEHLQLSKFPCIQSEIDANSQSFNNSFGGVPIRPRCCRCGRMANGTGTVPCQSRFGRKCSSFSSEIKLPPVVLRVISLTCCSFDPSVYNRRRREFDQEARGL